MALLGSSRPLPGQSWGPDGTQNPPKATPKLDQKWVQKGIQFWAALGPILGSVLGPKTVSSGGHIFQGFSVKSRPRSKHSSFSCFHVCVCVFFDVFWEFLFSITDVFQKWVPFLVLFWIRFWRQNGLQNGPKNGPKISSFLSLRWGLFF